VPRHRLDKKKKKKKKIEDERRKYGLRETKRTDTRQVKPASMKMETFAYNRIAEYISWQQTETSIRHSRRPRGQLLRHALRRPCIRCGRPKGMEPAAGAFTGTTDSWSLQDGIKDLSSLHPAPL